MAANAFQQGQEFARTYNRLGQEEEARTIALEEERKRQNALAQIAETEPRIYAPAALQIMQNENERGFRRDLATDANTRAGELHTRAIEEHDNNQLLLQGRRTTAFLKNGLEAGVPLDQLIARAGPSLTALGVAPEQQTQLLEAISADPTTLDAIDAALDEQLAGVKAIGKPVPIVGSNGEMQLMQTYSDGSTRIIEGVTPAETVLAAGRLDVAQQRANTGERVADTGEVNARTAQQNSLIAQQNADTTSFNAKLGATKEIREEEDALSETANYNTNVINAGTTVLRDTESILEIADKASAFEGNSFGEAVTRAVAAKVLSTDEREVQALIDSVKANVGIDALLRIKQSGAGLGQVPQSQLETLQSVLGNLDITRDPKLLLRDLRDIKRLYTSIVEGAKIENSYVDRRKSQLAERREKIEGEMFPGERGTNTPPATAPQSLDDLMQKYGQ